MLDDSIAKLAGRQFNRASRRQLNQLGASDEAIRHRLTQGRLVIVAEGVYAVAPVLENDWGRWMGATLTAPSTFLCRESAACAWGGLEREPRGVTVVRPGNGGPRRMSGITVYRSLTLEGEVTELRGVPITTPARTLLDLTCCTTERAVARALRQFVRLRHLTVYSLGDWLGMVSHRRGAPRLGKAMARYRGLPIERARSGAEVRALELLKHASIEMPRLNVDVANEEADLSWPSHGLIIEIDGGPFHEDIGEDARKEAAWRNAGWRVLRIDADDVYDAPDKFLALAPPDASTQSSNARGTTG